MSTVGFTTWFQKKCPTVFIVKNIAPHGKRIRIFNYPIKNGLERDLLDIPYVSEADIRHSLLKGELLTKLRSEEAIVTASNIDLLQFDNCQKSFLQSVGILNGLEVACSGGGELNFAFKQGVHLIGIKNEDNRLFYTPEPFINGVHGNNNFRILIRHNGRVLAENIDYEVVNSTTILLSFSPTARSVLIADYMVAV
ncbi:MAG: hypothetical protein WC942_07420 [Clostridia bacterium]|jgi:hypothetical protein